MKITAVLDIVEVDGREKYLAGRGIRTRPKLTVKNHWNNSSLAVLTVGQEEDVEEFTVIADELMDALRAVRS